MISMESNIQTLIHKFEEVKEIRKSNEVILNNISVKVSALHEVYVTYLKKTMRLEHNFGLDSFYFQKNIHSINIVLLEQYMHLFQI